MFRYFTLYLNYYFINYLLKKLSYILMNNGFLYLWRRNYSIH